jgi:hypothetical protein
MAATDVIILRLPVEPVPADWNPSDIRVANLMTARSYNGVSHDLAISALQKSVRRGWCEDAAYWALDVFFSSADGPVLTNLWNRMLVMAFEDVGPADMNAFPYTYVNCKSSRTDAIKVATCAWTLASMRKSRVNDWLCCCFRNYKDRATYAGISAAQVIGYGKDLAQILREQKPEDHMRAAELMQILIYYPLQVYVAYTGKRQISEHLLISTFREVIPRSEYLEACIALASDGNWMTPAGKHRKSPLIYAHILNLWMAGAWTGAVAATGFNFQDNAQLSHHIATFVQEFVNRGNIRGVPDIAADMHTRKGKSVNRDLAYFYTISSLLENEATEWKELSIFLRNRAAEEAGLRLG